MPCRRDGCNGRYVRSDTCYACGHGRVAPIKGSLKVRRERRGGGQVRYDLRGDHYYRRGDLNILPNAMKFNQAYTYDG